MPEFAVRVDGKKLVWDGELYSDETTAAERVKQYQGWWATAMHRSGRS